LTAESPELLPPLDPDSEMTLSQVKVTKISDYKLSNCNQTLKLSAQKSRDAVPFYVE